MEYIQMTMDDWQKIKDKMRNELLGVKQSFVRIGYILRQIEDQRLYEKDGYKSITEFASAEYGLGTTIVSRFKAINKAYSIDGYSEMLLPEYEDFKRSQLEEMLTLTEADRQMIEPETSRADIRELKQFNKRDEAIENNISDNKQQLIKDFFHDNKTELNQLYAEHSDSNELKEIVNPSGSRSYRKGMYFMMMNEAKIQIKKFGENPEELSWEEFYAITIDIFKQGNEDHTWQEYFGIAEETTIQEHHEKQETISVPLLKENPIKSKTPVVKQKNTHESHAIQTSKIAPAQKCIISEPETQEEISEKIEAVEIEIVEKIFGTRKEYMETLSECEMAKYMKKEYEEHRLSECMLSSGSELEIWLRQKVNDIGKIITQNNISYI